MTRNIGNDMEMKYKGSKGTIKIRKTGGKRMEN